LTDDVAIYIVRTRAMPAARQSNQAISKKDDDRPVERKHGVERPVLSLRVVMKKIQTLSILIMR
jgi:hypothetical protein